MDRGKSGQGKRPNKVKGSLPPGDLFALGSKPTKPGESGFQKGSSAGSSIGEKKLSALGDRKREPTSLLAPAGGVKKPKILAPGQTFTPLGRPADRDTEKRLSPVPPISLAFEESSIEVDSAVLLSEILGAEDSNDFDRLEGLLCGAVKYLHSNRSKPDQIMYLTLMHVAKAKPSIYNSELVIEAFCTLLKRDMSLNFKSKGNSLVSVLACNVLMKAYSDEDNWPDDFVKVYIDDALGERVWVDRSDCKGFVDNIVTAFNTNLPKGGLSSVEVKTEAGSASPVVSIGEDEDIKMEVDSEKSTSSTPELQNVTVYPRYPYQIDNIETLVLEIVHEQLVKRQLMDASSKSLIKLMTATCGYGEVRQIASQKLELWLQNPKLARASQELLMSVCMNCSQHDAGDMEVIAMLIKMRMKTKPLINHYLVCVRELLVQHTDNLRMVLTHTIYNELSTTRNPNNMALIGVVFTTNPDTAAKILAEIFQDLLTNKDDYLRALRALFREIVRFLRYEINFASFCLAIMQERTEPKFTDMEPAFKERYILAVTDLVSMCVLQAITPAVREAVTALNRGDKKDVDVIYNYQNLVATIQRDAVWWLHTIVPKFFEPKQQEYVFCMRKMLFMESGEQYAKDNWPAEADRSSMIRLATESPVLQDTLMRVLVIGLSRELSLSPQDAVEFVDILVRRAANLNAQGGRQVLLVERLELFDALLNLCTYRHPENIALPAGYTPPQLAISNLYWKAWTILLIISAYNPTSFGLAAWENYPTLKCMIEMVMTNNYKFPPPTTAVDDSVIEEIRSKEIQVAQKEKQEILEFEGYLAASTTKVTITEANSLLIAQLTTMEPNGPARKPPQQIMDQLRSINDSLRIGQMLCRSRSPDFLLDIIQRQGTSQSMPWLAELVESSEGSLDVLPVQCLCEFLLHETQDVVKDGQDDESVKFEKHKKKQKMKKQQQLLSRLQALVHDSNADSSTTHEVMDYFLKRLASTQAANRALATKGMSMIISRSQLSPTEEGPVSMETDVYHQHNWLLVNFPALPMFPQVKGKTCSALRQAIQIEADPSLVSAYIMFLSRHTKDQTLQDLDELALDIAQLIVERTTIINYILPQDTGVSTAFSRDTLEAFIQLFVNYLRKAKEPNTAGYSWSNTQDQIILQWESGESATMHILVVHAMIILLSYGQAHSEDLYKELLETWFPEKSKPPSAFLQDTSEDALLLPDWLKLRMIRSSAEPLIDAALQDLEPSQLLLFVQSFGIPVHSMSKLLQCLDNAVTMDVVSLEQSVLDKAYMAQLIEVQHKRGAQGGDKFYSMLTDGKTLEISKDDEKMDAQSADDSMWKGQGHIDVVMETIPASHVVNMLLQAFDPSGRRSPDTETHFRSLVMSVNKRPSGALDVVKGFNEILQGSSGAEFGKSVIQSAKACSLLRIILAKQNEAGMKTSLYQTMEMLGRHCVGQKSPMVAMVHQYMVSQTKQKSQRAQLRSEKQEQFLEDLTRVASSDSSQLESLVRESMRSTMKVDGTVSTTQLACSVLLRDQTQSDSGSMLPSTCALFVDWLELLDPEVIRMVPELQEKLLFARQSVSQSSQRREHSSQPYLLALLTHQSSWSTLNRCINSLLSRCDKGYDPVSVLDFLWACIHVPKIWQGRERKLPKNQSPEDVLCLTGSQLVILVSYIIQEATSQSCDTESANQIPVSIRNRIELLKACVCGNQDKVRDLVLYIETMLKLKSSNVHLYEAFLLELYLQYPFLSAWLSDSRCVTSEALASHHSQTQMDLITHRLITGLYQGSRSKRNDNRMADVNIACRKLAAEHPVLVLRQLPAIVALLKGKTQFTFAEFKQRNLLMLYINILGILELLQPIIFYKEHSTLNSILEEYFSLLTAYSCNTNKQMAPLIVKLVKMLNDYVNHDCQRANCLLQKHVLLLTNVSSQFPDLSPLKSLLAGLTLPRHSQEEVESTGGESGSVVYPVRPASPWAASHLAPFLQKIKKDNSDEVLMVLQDLDESSKRKVEILEHFVDDLKRLMLTHNDQSRNTAFELAKRHIKQNPKKAVDFVPAFLHCLESENPDIITSALTNLAEFTLLCQDYADVILQKALSAGINTSIETSSYITLQDLEPSQLLLFVQSFGIPVHSMSKLLQCLDNAVTMDVVSLEQSVLDKAYMAQLIEVQHKRGAQGGDKFYSMLTDGKTLEISKDDERMDAQSVDDSMWKGQGHIDVVMETIPASHVVNMLLQAFDPSGRRSPDTETHFRSLVMSVNKRPSGALDVVKGFNEILQGSSGAEFGKSVIQSAKACSLLRIILAKQNEAGMKTSLYQTMEMLGRHCVGQKSPMVAMVHQYMASQTKQKSQRPQLRAEKQEQFLEDLARVASSDSSQLESLVRESMRSTMKADGTVSTTQLACSVLLRDQTQSDSGSMLPSTCALFVDWLELLDPEVIRMVPELQEKLLFARQSVSQSNQRREHSSQPYLLALLTHQSNWSTLNRCINSLLSRCDKGYDPVSVLDFLWACIHVPKIWQGRERKLPKNQSPEDVLCLTGSQLVILVSYIIQEATSQSCDTESANQIPVSIRNRIELLKACVCGDQDKVRDLVLYIETMLKLKSSNVHLYEAFLLELYLQYPFLSAWLSDSKCVTSEALPSHHSQTQMDLITHRLITGLYQGSRSKRNDNRMADVNIACRKLAAEHPVLVLRQLPAIVALLKGKTQFTFAEFKQRNLLMLYINILGILELLQPSIFYKEHSTLNSILEEYFSLLTAYSCNTNKQMAPLIVKLVKMLNDYVNHDCQRANCLLQKHVLLLTNVSSQFPDLSPLKSLLAGLTLPRHSQEEVEATGGESGSVVYPVRPGSPWAASHLAPFLQKIKKDNSDEVLMVLQDLDESSKRKVEILEHFVDDLKRLMLTHNDQSRNTAFELAKRHIKQNPKKAVDFVPAFLHCLESENPDIITSALTNLAEFTLLCQDYADVILQKALSAGINTSIETSSYISESLQLLNLDLASA